VSGPSGSGKSSFCIRFLQNIDALCTERNFDGWVIWCYSEKTAVPNQKLAVLKKIRHNQCVPTDFENAHGGPCLIILDDLLNDAYSKEVCDLFTKGSHHRNMSVILITQNLFQKGRFYRNISLNAKYLVLLENTRDKNQFMFLTRQVYPENSCSLYKAKLNATQQPYGYLILHISQDTNYHLRVRTNIFPTDPPHLIIYAPIEGEASEIKLSRASRTEDGRTETAQSHCFEL